MVTRSESLSGNRQFGAKLDLFVADHDVAALLTGTPIMIPALIQLLP